MSNCMGHNNRILTDSEHNAWRNFLLAHGRLLARLDADLVSECDMTLAEYEVLLHLSEATDHRLRMNELADLARLSPSGLTRRFDALVRRGWVLRERCDDDRRGVLASLTKDGLKRLKAATPVHDRGESEYFFDVLDAKQVKSLSDAMAKVAAANAPDALLATV
ncbi:MarR family transcriptional regulator [soil metagenome]